MYKRQGLEPIVLATTTTTISTTTTTIAQHSTLQHTTPQHIIKQRVIAYHNVQCPTTISNRIISYSEYIPYTTHHSTPQHTTLHTTPHYTAPHHHTTHLTTPYHTMPHHANTTKTGCDNRLSALPLSRALRRHLSSIPSYSARKSHCPSRRPTIVPGGLPSQHRGRRFISRGKGENKDDDQKWQFCLLYTSPSPRD